MKTTLYQNIVLTVIAIALLLIALNPWLKPASVNAQYSAASNVRVIYVDPSVVRDISQGGGIPVRVVNP